MTLPVGRKDFSNSEGYQKLVIHVLFICSFSSYFSKTRYRMSLRSKSVCVLFYCILKEYGFYLVFYFKTEVLIVNDQNFWPSSELNINMFIMSLNCVILIIISISSVLTNIQKHVKHVGGKENFSNS